jgi:asparagine synthase (glutamine-hydrolysing)
VCGIAGFIGAAGNAGADRQLLERMLALLAHRGPDGKGIHLENGIGLAHVRLSIIDPAGGEQPMRHGPLAVSFNGEIFNYIELRGELRRLGHAFRTDSDTEVILHLYERYGDRFVEHLNGQFAIAIWDGAGERLLLARDRAGIRPLFHARGRGRLWFASEIKAILAALPERAVLDTKGLLQTFTFWGPADPGTVFEGVSSVPPGTLVVLDRNGAETHTRYWDWTFPSRAEPTDFASIDEATDALRELLVDAVRLQLRADVPVGAYLSGGLDSSGIVALARRFTDAPVRTFSIAFEDAEFDESGHQQAMVRHIGTEHTTLRCKRRDIGEAFPRLIRHTEAPVLRTAPAPLMLLAQSVREAGYKVVLTGEGADEVFAGYDIFKEAKVRRFWARQPDSEWRPRLLGRLYGYLEHSPVENPAFARAFFGQGREHAARPIFAHVPRWTTSGRALAFLSADLKSAADSWDPLAFYEERLPQNVMDWTPLARDQYVEAKSLMASYLLSSQGDRVAMASSIEGRFPYLDHRLIEFANRLPARWKLRGLTEKFILRRALGDLLPEDILKRTKQPYRSPDARSFFIDGKPLDFVGDLLCRSRIRAAGYFDEDAVSRLLEKCRSGRAMGFADNQAFVGILSTMLLDEIFVRQRNLSSAAA